MVLEVVQNFEKICDSAVANGGDIIDINSLIKCMKTNCKGVVVIPIDDEYVPVIQNITDANRVLPRNFSNTSSFLECDRTSYILQARRPNCISCT